jgi:hypothetical protein
MMAFIYSLQSKFFRASRMVAKNKWCGYKITGFNFFPVPCKLGNTEPSVVLVCTVPCIHCYNFKVVGQTVQQ